eukprot:TRINITY_DN9007_c2_g4_i1.p1 TRINITY_DN9007_c2_g4~~TRINITY_DN9007_c2_g4_i1.p1  ORF type:complete len:135 (-),score=31.55 TRINITY_DN9007_c2_g4_i1:249-653(-)
MPPPQALYSKEDEDEDEDCPQRVEALRLEIRQEGDKEVLYGLGMQMDPAEAERMFTIQSSTGSDAENRAKELESFNLLFGETMPQQASRAYTTQADVIASAESGDVRRDASRDLCPEPVPRSMTEPVPKVVAWI